MCRSASTGAARRSSSRADSVTRFGDMVASVLSHRTVERRDPAAGGAHRLIFYGFVLLFPGTATITLEYDILEPLFGIRFWHGEFYLVFSLVLDVAGVALIAGLLLHDVSARLAATAEARLCAAGPPAGRSGLRPAAIPPRGLGVSVDAADHRAARATCSRRRGWCGSRTARTCGIRAGGRRSARCWPRACAPRA